MISNIQIKRTAIGKSAVVAMGICLLLASMAFGDNSNHNVAYSFHQGVAIADFTLVRSQSPVFQYDFAAMNKRFSRKESSIQNSLPAHWSDDGILSTHVSAGEAQDEGHKRKLGIKLEIGGATITGGGYGTALAYGGGIYSLLSEKIALEVLLEHYEVPVHEDLGGLGAGTLNVTPLLVNGQYRFPLGSIVPYVLIGVGFYFFHFEPAEEVERFAEEEGLPENEVVDRFALHLGGGLDFRVSHKLDFTVELKYNLAKTWVQERGLAHVEPAEQDIFNLYALAFVAGIKYYF